MRLGLKGPYYDHIGFHPDLIFKLVYYIGLISASLINSPQQF
jgi:hypothetical protein